MTIYHAIVLAFMALSASYAIWAAIDAAKNPR